MQTKSFKRALLASAGMFCLIAAPALAQEVAPAATTGIETVIVTAQLRAENLQDVPVSAAAISDDKMSSMFTGGEDIVALATRVPGLYAESSNGRAAPRFYIRGLGNTDFDLAASQPVSVVYDDVIMENVALKSTPLFDLDQVEVYRGPQGTLFGRNTTAGIIRLTSVKPSDQFKARAEASYGSYGTSTFDGGATLPLIDGVLSARASLLWQHRDDWVDNTEIAGSNNLGGFEETAARLQFLYTPTDRFKALINIHGRDLDGTSALFRANVITTGTNGLNGNYTRDRVSYNQGGNNEQAYNGWGSSARLDYDFGPVTLTSITAYENANGRSRGDIDGGVAGVGPGFIPFDSDTQDSLDDLDQTTQELRLASNGAGPLTWQGGVYYFDSSFTVTTVGPSGFPPPATLTHDNTSWAVFGQASYAFTDKFKGTVGARYTNDDKDLTVLGNAGASRSVSDDHVSWEISGMYDVTPDFSLYARVADGFRGPSIQGRDVAFFSPPSVAQSETILSFEAGWKSTLLNDTLRLNGAAYTYEVSDIQLTAVGGAGNTVQLLNADKGKAYGLEVDAEYAPMRNLVFTGGLSYTHTELDDSSLAVGYCAQCTVTDPIVTLGLTSAALIDGNPFPNAPELIADVTARYSIPMGSDGELFAFTDWTYQGKTNLFLYESTEFQTDNQVEGGLKFGYAKTDGSWEIAIFARNITDEDNIKGAIDFNNNTAFVNDPRIIGVSLKAAM